MSFFLIVSYSLLAKENIAIFQRALPEYTETITKQLSVALKKQDIKVTPLTIKQVCDTNILSVSSFFAYVIPNARVYPPEGYSALQKFAEDGGHIIFIDGPAFDNKIWEIKKKWISTDEIIKKRNIKNAHTCFKKPFPSYGWIRQTFSISNKCLWEAVSDVPKKGEQAFHFLCEKLEGWDGFISKKLNEPLFFGNDNLIFFFARGDANTPQISVELQEEDGSRWIATAFVGTNWQRVILPLAAFKFWGAPSAAKRGGKEDRLNPKKVYKINFGLSMTHTPLSARETKHEFWINGVKTLRDELLSKILSNKEKVPIFETISPSYKVYGLKNISKGKLAAPWRSNDKYEKVKLNKGISAVSRPHGRGFNHKQKYRFVSLIDALDEKGNCRGSLAWLLLNRNAYFSNVCFVGFASSETNFLKAGIVSETLVDILNRLHRGTLLINAGAREFSYFPGEKIYVGAHLIHFGKKSTNTFLKFVVKKADKSVAMKRKVKVDFKNNNEFSTNFPINISAKAGDVFTVEVSVIENGKLADKITHEFGIICEKANDKDDFVKVKGNQFYLSGKPWYPVGINYWPSYVAGMEKEDFFAGWLNPKFYAPEEVERDLILMEKLGINMVSIQGDGLDRYRELQDFLRRCAAHNIKVNLFLRSASPLNFKEEELKEYINQARLKNNSTLFAYDIIWEPGNYVFNKEKRHWWDADWRIWIVERYGSEANAEKEWEFPAPRDNFGKITAPPDKFFRENGKWRVMMAAYRRFMNNIMSRKWNYAYRTLKGIDPNHLVSFRQGNTLPHDFTFTATAKHVDFFCPEGYTIANKEDSFFAAGFITRFVHFVTAGKPIIWAEFGKHVWDKISMCPSEKLIKEQNLYFNRFFKMALESGANGVAPWWWPGGYRVDEKSDYGVINQDRTLRPSARTIAKYAPKVKKARKWPAAADVFEIDLDEHSGGYWYLCFNKGKEAYRKAREQGKNLGIRTLGTGTTSVNTPLIAVGNRPYNGQNPPKYLDAEFNWFKIYDAEGNWTNAQNGMIIFVKEGEAVRAKVSVGNTQEATWIPPNKSRGRKGGVVLTSTANSDISFRRAITKRVPYLKDADFGEFILTDTITNTQTIEAGLQAEGRCTFGETINFTLKTKK